LLPHRVALICYVRCTNGLELGNEWIMFDARFSGKAFNIAIPSQALLAIYSQETGQGLIFDEEDDFQPDPIPDPPLGTSLGDAATVTPIDKKPSKPKGKPALRVVK